MSRYFRAGAAALAISGGLGSVGCVHTSGSKPREETGGCNRFYDTAWPDRYNFAARQATVAPFAQQVTNGQFYEQTVWNWYFEPGTDRLNGAGMAKLDSLAQKTPSPDPRIYLQAARDVAATPDNYDKVVAQRDDLTGRRAAAVQRYMATQPGAPVAYEIAVHDAPVPGIYSPFSLSSFRGQTRGYVGGISGAAVTGALNPTGAGGGGQAGAGVGAAAGAGGAVQGGGVGTGGVPDGSGGTAPPPPQ
jgi:hypothetical protein